MKRKHLVDIFFGDQRPLNEDLLYLILEIAGLAKYGRTMSYFAIYFRPSHKWRDTKKAPENENARLAHGFGT